MSVFVAAGDEHESNAFLYGGFVAPSRDWIDWFAPAWEQRVMNGSPPIPYLHMAEIRSRKWRSTYGLGEHEAESRVDEASKIIRSLGSLHFIKSEVNGGHFQSTFGETKVIRPGKQPGVYAVEPDYVCFLGVAYGALEYVTNAYPDAEKVDFIVEHKNGVTNHFNDYFDSIAEDLRHKGEGHLVRLIGDLSAGGNDRVPLQAADVGLWHLARHERREGSRADERRTWRMFHNRPITINGKSSILLPDKGVPR